jgi:hypothetical protein
MHKSPRLIVVIVALAGLAAVGVMAWLAPAPATTAALSRYRGAARDFAYRAYETATPWLSIQHWRAWAQRQDSLAAKPPLPSLVIRHVYQHRAHLAAAPSPPAPALASVPGISAPPRSAAEDAGRHTMSKAFEGCWQGTVTQPDTWQYIQGPEPSGWSPATYTVCIHHAGKMADADVSIDTTLHLTSQWVAPATGARTSHTDIIFQSPDQVILRTTGRIPLELKVMGFLPGPKPLVTYTDLFRCSVQDGKLDVLATMVDRCDGSAVENCRGQPWVRQSWHQQLARLSQ